MKTRRCGCSVTETVREISVRSGAAADTLAERLQISRGSMAVEVHRARRRFADLLRNEVAQTVADPTEMEAELRHLLRVLSRVDSGT